MTEIPKPSKAVEQEKLEQSKKSGPSGATAKSEEREKKFDEEGGDQPQAPSQQDADDALDEALSQRQRQHSSGQSQSNSSDKSDQHRSGASPDYQETGAHRSGNQEDR